MFFVFVSENQISTEAFRQSSLSMYKVFGLGQLKNNQGLA